MPASIPFLFTIGNYMTVLQSQVVLTLRWALRDRLLHAVLGVALFCLLLVPVFSSFSMRQVQELAITLSLSSISGILLVLATLLGASSIWRDIEKRYATSVLSLPVSRAAYVLGKFFGIAIFLIVSAVLLGLLSAVAIVFASMQYPSATPVHWTTLGLCVAADCLKYILLAAVALLFSCVSTSFFLPFFGTIAIYFAGSSSQQVYEYISGELGKTISEPVKILVKGVYYLLPNLSAFNLKVQAIYGLPLSISGLLYTVGYFLLYTSILLYVSVWFFARRELQ
jgi:ABC-type transport system involved in multi-copper enzyme maturation permease subunit